MHYRGERDHLMWGYGKKLVDAWQNSALKLQFWPRMIDSVEREKGEKPYSHSYVFYLQLEIYIYKARSPNYHTCDLY